MFTAITNFNVPSQLHLTPEQHKFISEVITVYFYDLKLTKFTIYQHQDQHQTFSVVQFFDVFPCIRPSGNTCSSIIKVLASSKLVYSYIFIFTNFLLRLEETSSFQAAVLIVICSRIKPEDILHAIPLCTSCWSRLKEDN